jgi:hypothetical protein
MKAICYFLFLNPSHFFSLWTDAEARHGVGSQGLDHGAHAVVSVGAALELLFDLANLNLQIVVNQQNLRKKKKIGEAEGPFPFTACPYPAYVLVFRVLYSPVQGQ